MPSGSPPLVHPISVLIAPYKFSHIMVALKSQKANGSPSKSGQLLDIHMSGERVGLWEGLVLGLTLGEREGLVLGFLVGLTVGLALGLKEGEREGLTEGLMLGLLEGLVLGAEV